MTTHASASSLTTPRRAPRRPHLTELLLGLALTMAAAALLGPVGLDLMDYRTSPTTLNQLMGSDAAALFVVAPLTLVVAALALRGHRAAPLLGAGIGGYAVYTFAQVVIGQEYLRLPGNVERFFPLLLAVFLLGQLTVVVAWRRLPEHLPLPSERLRNVIGIVLILVAMFLVLGLHLRTMLTAWDDPMSMTEYASSPTPFWMVKLMDLGIVAPLAVATGFGVLRGSAWALRVMYPLLTGYACLAVSVAAMGLVMIANDDPDASLGLAGGFLAFALAFVGLTVALYRPLFSGLETVGGAA